MDFIYRYKRVFRILRALSLSAWALALWACAPVGRGNPKGALYQHLGGEIGVRALVQELIDLSVKDARIAHHFAKKDIPHIKKMVAEQICFLSGGPCRYRGKDMKTIHAGLRIREADFNAFTENLQKSFEKHGVPQEARNALLRILAPMRKDILYK